MHVFSKSLVALLLVAGTSASVMAQSSSSSTPPSSSSSAPSSSSSSSQPPSSSSSSVSYEMGEATHGNLISALQTGTALDFSAYDATTSVTFVPVSALSGNADNSQALDNALKKNAETVTKIQAAFAANAALSAKLDAAGYESDQILAVTVETDGSLVVYIDDRG